MKEWNEAVQRMIEWIETHPDQNRVLENLSDEIGYSPWYCSVLFHDMTGMTLKAYTSGRHLARAAEEIRDTEERILDIALKYGYSFLENRQRRFYFAMRIEDYERAEQVLINAGFKPIMQDELHRIFF